MEQGGERLPSMTLPRDVTARDRSIANIQREKAIILQQENETYTRTALTNIFIVICHT